ncbi:hypothetical protein G9A89_014437 [Geosiphon pyriformis]|nr:hypothetical protein G9A89_014437 [Geosiphon pyriformis]
MSNTTQYQALVGNNWLSKTNAILDWTTQELQLSGNGQYTHVPAMCDHFKVPSKEEPLIELEKEKKPIWKAFQNNKGKKKEEELIWKPNLEAWGEDELSESTTEWAWEEKRKEKEKEDNQPPSTNSAHIPYSTLPQTEYHQSKLVCVSCGKKLSTMGQLNTTVTYVFLNAMDDCQKWENGTRALRYLEEYPHNKDEIWKMEYAMSEGVTTEKLREIKDNPLLLPELEYVQMFDIFGNIENDLKKFHEHYQRLAPTKEEQEERLAQLNTQLCNHCLIPCDF